MIGTVLINHKRKISPFDKGYPILMPVYINKNVLSENELLLLRSFIQDIETEQLETENKMSLRTK